MKAKDGHKKEKGKGKTFLEARVKFALCLFTFSFCLGTLRAGPPSGDDPYRLYLRALLQERFGKPEDALSDLEKVAALDPGEPFVHETLAFLALRLNRMDQALAEARKVVELRRADPHSHLLLGRVRLARDEAEEAGSAFDQALRLDPNDGEALLYAAHLRAFSRPQESLVYYDRFLQNNPDSPDIRARMAEIQQRLGNVDAAAEAWKKILELDPSDFSAHLALAHIHEARRDTAAAVASYEACRFIDPQNMGVLMRLGELHYRVGDSAAARESFEQAARLAPKDLTVQFWLGILAEERQDWDDAARRMAAVARESREPGVLLRLAYYHSQRGLGRDAVKVLRRLQKQEPGNPDFMYYLALGYEDLRRPAAAIRWLKRVAALDPARADVQLHIGTNYEALRRPESAQAAFLRALELDPQNPITLNYVGYTWADQGKNLERALEYIRRAVAIEPENGAYLDSLGWVYFKLGRLAEAEEVLAGVAPKMEDPVVWMHYGDVLARREKTREAEDAWREGLILDPRNRDLRGRLGKKGRGSSAAAPRTILKGIEGNFRQLRSLAGFMRVGGRDNGRSFQAQGMIYYVRPQLFRLEFLGPFLVPQALLVQNSTGLHRMPRGGGLGRNEEERWLRLFGEFLSGDLIRRFDSPDVRVERAGDQLTYSAAFGEIQVDGEKKIMTRLAWRGGGEPSLFLFRDYREVEGLWLPSRVDCEMPEAGIKISLDLKRLKVNSALDASLFTIAE